MSFPWRALLLLSLLSLSLTLAFAVGALGGVPHVQDEQAYLLQARILAAGQRVAETPVDGILNLQVYLRLKPEYYAIFPPGWPAVLAIGVLAGAPWLVNPLLSALLPWLAWAAFQPLLPRASALLTAGLFALSPAVLVLGGSMMSHTLVLATGLGALATLTQGRAALFGGLLLGLMCLARPYDGFLLGGPLIALALWQRRPLFLLGPILAIALTAIDNQRLTGDPLVFPVDHYYDTPTETGQTWPVGCNRLGFGPDRGCYPGGAPGHDLGKALSNMGANALRFDRLLLGFPLSGLLVLAGLPLLVRQRWWLALPAALIPAGYALYWYDGVVYGARFWSGALIAALPAAALALQAIGARTRPAVAWLVPGLGLLSVLPGLWAELSDRYWCVDPEVAAVGRAVGEGIILLDDQGRYTGAWPLTTRAPLVCDANLSFGAGIGQNDPLGRAPLHFLRMANPEKSIRTALRHHPDAPVYVLHHDLAARTYRLEPVDRAGVTDPPP